MSLQPQGLPPGFRPSIPPIIPLEQTDPERQRAYGELAAAAQELEKPLDLEGGSAPLPVPSAEVAAPPEPAAKVYLPSDDDKREFVRSILAAKPYEKSYVLFGGVKANFIDRTPADTLLLYAHLDKEIVTGHIVTEEEWQVGLERVRLATDLRTIKGGSLDETLNGMLNDRINRLLALPRPLYEALMEAGRHFEGHIDYLVERAADPNFWRTGGGD